MSPNTLKDMKWHEKDHPVKTEEFRFNEKTLFVV